MSENTKIWDALCKTDPAHTKSFNRSGGFKGTAIKPIWIVRRLTEQFGPVGEGWGMDEPTFQVVPAGEEILVYCTVRCWHTKSSNSFFGVGGDKVLAKFTSGLKTDDEAFKKAFTDAVGNAFKFVGIGADVHMGQFDDSKYVQAMEREFAKEEPKPKGWREEGSAYSTPTALHKGLQRLERELFGCGDSEMVYGLTATDDWKEFVRVAQIHAPHYLRGGDPAPPEFKGLLNIAEQMVQQFDSDTAGHMADIARA